MQRQPCLVRHLQTGLRPPQCPLLALAEGPAARWRLIDGVSPAQDRRVLRALICAAEMSTITDESSPHSRLHARWVEPCRTFRLTLPVRLAGCYRSSIGFPRIDANGSCPTFLPVSRSGRSWCPKAWLTLVLLVCRRSWASTQSFQHCSPMRCLVRRV